MGLRLRLAIASAVATVGLGGGTLGPVGADDPDAQLALVDRGTAAVLGAL